MILRKHHKMLLVTAIVTSFSVGCIDLVTESVKDGVGDAISGAVANASSSMLAASEDG